MVKFDFEITSEEPRPNVTLVNINGFMDRHTCDLIDDFVKDLIKKRKRFLVFNLEKVDYISSEGIGFLFSALGLTEELKGSIVLMKLDPNVKGIFDRKGCTSLLTFVDNFNEAIAYFQVRGFNLDEK